jgi:hypothetical protein
MFRLGLFQMGLGMMSVLIFGVMKLLYRGIPYQCNPPYFRIIETELALKYRGANWRLQQLLEVPMQKPDLQLKYRGIAYSTTQSLTSEFFTLTFVPT